LLRVTALLLMAGIAAVSLSPQAAKADTSKCTARIKAQGFFITDIDTDWGPPLRQVLRDQSQQGIRSVDQQEQLPN
jgi:hypothetical protein